MRRLGEELRNVAVMNGVNTGSSVNMSLDSNSGFTTLLEMSRDVLNESEGSVLIGDLMGDGNDESRDSANVSEGDGTVVNYAEEQETDGGEEGDGEVVDDDEGNDDESAASDLPPQHQPEILMANSNTQTDPSPISPEFQRQLQKLSSERSNLAAELASMRNRNEFLTTANNELAMTTRRMEEEWKSMNMERVEKDGMVRKLEAVVEAMKGELDAIVSSEARLRQGGGKKVASDPVRDELNSRLDKLRGELNEMTSTNAVLRQENAAKNAEVEGWKEENLGLCERVAGLERRVKVAKRTMEEEEAAREEKVKEGASIVELRDEQVQTEALKEEVQEEKVARVESRDWQVQTEEQVEMEVIREKDAEIAKLGIELKETRERMKLLESELEGFEVEEELVASAL